jgi:hypothetical protein
VDLLKGAMARGLTNDRAEMLLSRMHETESRIRMAATA